MSKILILDKELARTLAYDVDTAGYVVVDNRFVGRGRWNEHYRLVIKDNAGDFWTTIYRVAATEMQDEIPFENTDPVFNYVIPVEKTVIVYEEPK